MKQLRPALVPLAAGRPTPSRAPAGRSLRLGLLAAVFVAPPEVSRAAAQLPDERATARLRYLGTSGWYVETAAGSLVIDYVGVDAAGASVGPRMTPLPPRDVRRGPTIVIATHEHDDHFSPSVRSWADSLPGSLFAAGGSVPIRAGDVRLEPRRALRVGPAQLWTIRSTDEGVGVLARLGGVTIFHAGDHARWNEASDSAYRAEIDFLAALGVVVDIAFLPIATGSRCGATESIRAGALHAIDRLRPRVAVPMHVRCADQLVTLYSAFADSAAGRGALVVAPRAIGEEFDYDGEALTRRAPSDGRADDREIVGRACHAMADVATCGPTP